MGDAVGQTFRFVEAPEWGLLSVGAEAIEQPKGSAYPTGTATISPYAYLGSIGSSTSMTVIGVSTAFGLSVLLCLAAVAYKYWYDFRMFRKKLLYKVWEEQNGIVQPTSVARKSMTMVPQKHPAQSPLQPQIYNLQEDTITDDFTVHPLASQQQSAGFNAGGGRASGKFGESNPGFGRVKRASMLRRYD